MYKDSTRSANPATTDAMSHHDPHHPAVRPPPMFNLPPGVKSLILVLICVYLAQYLMPWWLDLKLENALGYIPLRFWRVLHGTWAGPGIEIVATPVTYMFLHGSWIHLGVNVLSLAAFGSRVEEMAGPRFMTWLFLTCGVIGAFTEFAAYPRSPDIIVGASAGISGLFAVAFLSMAREQNMSSGRLALVTVMTLVIMVVTGLGGVPGTSMRVAWIAHIGGFLSGIVAEGCISRGRSDHDIRWFMAMMALPLFVIILNVARYPIPL